MKRWIGSGVTKAKTAQKWHRGNTETRERQHWTTQPPTHIECKTTTGQKQRQWSGSAVVGLTALPRAPSWLSILRFLAVLDPRISHNMDALSPFISLSSVNLIDSTTRRPVHVLMSIQAVHGSGLVPK